MISRASAISALDEVFGECSFVKKKGTKRQKRPELRLGIWELNWVSGFGPSEPAAAKREQTKRPSQKASFKLLVFCTNQLSGSGALFVRFLFTFYFFFLDADLIYSFETLLNHPPCPRGYNTVCMPSHAMS